MALVLTGSGREGLSMSCSRVHESAAMRHMFSREMLACVGVLFALAVMVRLPVRAAQGTAAGSDNPAQLIESVAHAILNPIDTHPDQYRPGSITRDRRIKAQLMPHFDVRFAAQFVLGPRWRQASPEQRLQFTNGFYQLLLLTAAMI